MVLLDELCLVNSLLGLTTECQVGGHGIDECMKYVMWGGGGEGKAKVRTKPAR